MWSHALSAEGFDVRIVAHVDAAQEWSYWEAEGGGGGPFAAADELAVGIAWSVSGLGGPCSAETGGGVGSLLVERRCERREDLVMRA